jgi:PAS domain S-box-containing protein
MISFTNPESTCQFITVSAESTLLEVIKQMAAMETHAAIVQSQQRPIGYFESQSLVQIIAKGRCLESTLVVEIMVPISQAESVASSSRSLPQELAQIMQKSFYEGYHNQKQEGLITTIANRLRESYDHNQALKEQIQERTQSYLKSQEELKGHEQFLRSIYEGSDAPIWVIDIQEDGTFLQGGLNPKAETFMGIRAADAAGKPLANLFGAEQGIEVCKLFAQCVERDISVTYEEYREFKGKPYWFSTTLTPLKNSAGRIYRLVGHSLDITARKEAEILQQEHVAELTKWQNRYETAGQASGQILYEYDIEADHPIWGANTEAILGYSVAKMPNNISAWIELIHPEDRELFHFQRQLLLRQRIPLRMEYRFCHSNGTYIWLEDKSRHLHDSNAETHRVVGFISDISEKKEAAIQLQHINQKLALKNEELACAMQMKDQFLANMSHELRTPLNAILGNSEILLDEILGSMNERQHKAVDSIERSGQHLLSLINDILDLAKIESGQVDLQWMSINIQSLCNSSLSFVQPLAQKKQIQLTSSIVIPEKAMIKGDERRLRQILLNLLNNSVKFTPEGGTVTLEVQSNVQAKTVQFAVKDTGVGISPKHLNKLFQSFVQVDSSLTRRHEGTGLGLAIVKKIVELHNGTVSVESTVGQGSCFTVLLPWQ